MLMDFRKRLVVYSRASLIIDRRLQTFEPFLRHLLSDIEGGDASVSVDEIWSFEAVNHGDAALLNEGKLGAICKSLPPQLSLTTHPKE